MAEGSAGCPQETTGIGDRPSAVAALRPTPVGVAVSTDPGPRALRAWDDLAQRTPGTDVTQLSAWARVRALYGYTPLYLAAYRAGELVGGAQILVRRFPVVGSIGYLPYGPLVDPAIDDRAAVGRALADCLRQLCRERLCSLFVQPPEGGDDVTDALLLRGFRPSCAGIGPTGSLRIDLTDDLATIRSRFGRKLRSWPHRWEARGVTVTVGDEADVPVLVRLMAHSAQRQGFAALPADYVASLYRELAAGGNAVLFVGRVHGEPVAADLVTVCGDMIRGRLTGFDRCGEAARLSVPAAIRWEIIKWGKQRGLRWLDFGGLAPSTLAALLDGDVRSPDVASADQPKLTFGGTAFRYPPAMELVAPAALRLAYDVARRSHRGRAAIDRARVALRGSGRRSRTPSTGSH